MELICNKCMCLRCCVPLFTALYHNNQSLGAFSRQPRGRWRAIAMPADNKIVSVGSWLRLSRFHRGSSIIWIGVDISLDQRRRSCTFNIAHNVLHHHMEEIFFLFSCSLLLLFLLNKPANLYRYGACLSLSDLETMHLIVFRCICGASDDGGRADVLSSVTAVAGGGWRWPSTIMYRYMFYCSSNTWIVLMCDSMCVCVYVSGTHIAPGVKATRQ